MVDATEAKQVTSAASSVLFPELEFGVVLNATYTREEFDPLLSRIAFDNEFANAGAKGYQCARGEDVELETDARIPLARALLYNHRDLNADGIDTSLRSARLPLLARRHFSSSPHNCRWLLPVSRLSVIGTTEESSGGLTSANLRRRQISNYCEALGGDQFFNIIQEDNSGSRMGRHVRYSELHSSPAGQTTWRGAGIYG